MRTTKNGMTLVELLVASAILALALIPVCDLIIGNSRQTRCAADRMFASLRARAIIDRYRALGASKLAPLFPEDGSGSAAVENDSLLSPQLGFAGDERLVPVVKFTAAPGGRAGQLVVKMLWQSSVNSGDCSLVAADWVAERGE